ncbi:MULTISPECIES: FAD-dependent oxidoreductase [Rhizobium/Agrobacterium group]|nr:FAD-dependent oxidoreductase [Agrobacterium vitis]
MGFAYTSKTVLEGLLSTMPHDDAPLGKIFVTDLPPYDEQVPQVLLMQAAALVTSYEYSFEDLAYFLVLPLQMALMQKSPSLGKDFPVISGYSITKDSVHSPVAFGRNLMPRGVSCEFPQIDVLYDYRGFLEGGAFSEGVTSFPKETKKPKVAVIGAGISGLVSATLLLRNGIDDVTIFEAKNVVGGRAHTHFFKGEPSVCAELGAMRFPRSQACLFYLLEYLGINAMTKFPNPGTVDTGLYYRGRSYNWKAHSLPPAIFNRVHKGWRTFLHAGFVDGVAAFASPFTLTECLRLRNYEFASSLWQKWLDAFSSETFSSGIERIFRGAHPPGGEKWTRDVDMELFKELGVGSGGFGPVFGCGFIEILRLIVNGYEDNVMLLLDGIEEIPRRLSQQKVGSYSIRDRIIHKEVKEIIRTESGISLAIGEGMHATFDRVIVTSGFTNIQLRHLLTNDDSFFSYDVNQAIENSHMTGSSKLFVLTQNKFWKAEELPSCILTTGVAKAVYCLDYEPDKPSGKGLVLLSYTWEDDSHKLLTFDKGERFQILKRDLAKSYPRFADLLEPADGDYDNNIIQHDWILDPYAGGAFKLNRRCEDVYSKRLFFQPLRLNGEPDGRVCLAGCSCSFSGGWVEGAIQTACNAAMATIRDAGGLISGDNPLTNEFVNYHY